MNMTTTPDEQAAVTIEAKAPLSIGNRIDAALARVQAEPLLAVSVGFVAGYLLARLLDGDRDV